MSDWGISGIVSSILHRLGALASAHLGEALAGIVVLLAGLGLAWLLRRAVRHVLRRQPLEVELLASRLVYIAALVAVTFWALATAGVHIAAIATLLGTIGLALSLAVQSRAQDIVAGLYLLMERSLRVGDQVSLRGFSGRIESIGTRTVLIRTDDGMELLVPNTVIMSEIVVKTPEQKPAAAPANHTGAATPT